MGIGYQEIEIVGYLGRDSEMTFTDKGDAVTKFSVGVSEYAGKNAKGEVQEKTTWFNVVAWRTLAENCVKFTNKGTLVMVKGRLAIRKYTNKEGNDATAIEVIANLIKPLSSKKDSQSQDTSHAADNAPLDDLSDEKIAKTPF